MRYKHEFSQKIDSIMFSTLLLHDYHFLNSYNQSRYSRIGSKCVARVGDRLCGIIHGTLTYILLMYVRVITVAQFSMKTISDDIVNRLRSCLGVSHYREAHERTYYVMH
ncbi:PREDICTED: uncharacterized protein LOC108763268 [Trachymyrmex cornetzi]|uniref:uncharacterized protein LOC108763268 n=1 Tax=Trachymyrmex cornetzi TaxID=471704 RepID=UPI00084EE6B1|nr:PREDICTED: uncharacterized protein LOC108763268 [Trachymyrmex cornetzi]